MYKPANAHWTAVNRILRYLKGSITSGLQSCQDPNFGLHGFSDIDWGGNPDDRHSVSAFAMFLGSSLVF